MKRLYIRILTAVSVCIMALSCNPDKAQQSHYLANRAPLAETAFLELPLGTVKAGGWLQDQLERQRTGMTGHMDSIYVLVDGPRNAWLGGDGDCWEIGI